MKKLGVFVLLFVFKASGATNQCVELPDPARPYNPYLSIVADAARIRQHEVISYAQLVEFFARALHYCQAAQRDMPHEVYITNHTTAFYKKHSRELTHMIAAYPKIVDDDIAEYQAMRDPRVANWIYWLTDLKRPRLCAEEIITKIESMCKLFW